MTAHDDDQDLITIRIPRRAAELYAVELEIASSPWMVKANLYGAFAVASVIFVAAAALMTAGIVQSFAQEYLFATNCFVGSGIASLTSGLFLVMGIQRLWAAKQRGLL